MENLLDRYRPLIQIYWFPLVLGSLALMFLAYGLIQLVFPQSEDSIIFNTENSSINYASPPVKNEASYIVIDVDGAVVNPGVYKLPVEARVQDALIIAGGLAEGADRDFVSKNINLAQKMQDGSKVYIPFMGEAVSGASTQTSTGQIDQTTIININSATDHELDTLPGIGPATASKIIENRPYQAVEELVEKKVIGQKTFEKIKDKISVN